MSPAINERLFNVERKKKTTAVVPLRNTSHHLFLWFSANESVYLVAHVLTQIVVEDIRQVDIRFMHL